MLEATILKEEQNQEKSKRNDHKRSASLLPEEDHPLMMIKEVIGHPQQRVCQTVSELTIKETNTVLMSPPRIGHTNEQVVPREEKSPKGETLENLNALQKDSPL